MTVDLTTIAILTTTAVLYTAVLPRPTRPWALFVGSVVAIYWLQPDVPLRWASFALQTSTLGLTVLGWWLTRPAGAPKKLSREDGLTLALLGGLVIALSFFRFAPAGYNLLGFRPPDSFWLTLTLLGVGVALAVLLGLARRFDERQVLTGGMLLIVVLFVILKTEGLTTAVAGLGRGFTGQDPSLASPLDLSWLGFSYVAFRLIHTLRDRQNGILPTLNLREYVTYIIFFPSYIAGPIDRAERFIKDLRAVPSLVGLDGARYTTAFLRIALGLTKKFIIADTLAQGMSLTPQNALQTESAFWLWILLYGYALRLYFDFSGYTDIAIGLGLLLGIKLPENFRWPYLKTNITSFWQSWHITLSDWARFYVFSPLSRTLLRRKPRPDTRLIVLVSQLATMLTIGLWHGVTVNFFIWGLWHGLGLFMHKQWSDRTRSWYRALPQKRWQWRAWQGVSWFVTLQFVVLGWVWFLLPEVNTAVVVFTRLFGF